MARPTDYAFILATILFTVFGQLIMKWRMMHLEVTLEGTAGQRAKTLFLLLFDPFIMLSLIMALCAALAWMGALTKFELSFAYPFISLSFVFVVLTSGFLFNESLGPMKVTAVVIIALGLILLART